jgi:hypothetical protein
MQYFKSTSVADLLEFSSFQALTSGSKLYRSFRAPAQLTLRPFPSTGRILNLPTTRKNTSRSSAPEDVECAADRGKSQLRPRGGRSSLHCRWTARQPPSDRKVQGVQVVQQATCNPQTPQIPKYQRGRHGGSMARQGNAPLLLTPPNTKRPVPAAAKPIDALGEGIPPVVCTWLHFESSRFSLKRSLKYTGGRPFPASRGA